VRTETTGAIVLRTQDYGESDRIVTVLSRDAGKFAGVAKGAKRSRRRFPGSLEIFAHVRLDYRHREGAELAFLERAVLVRPWRSLGCSLERYAAASHVVEVADKLTAEREVGDELYRLVLATLARLDADEPGPATLRLFELAALSACGYGPELGTCRTCRRPLDARSESVRITPRAGGVTCRDCGGRGEGGVIVSAAALGALRGLQDAVGRALAASRRNGSSGLESVYQQEASFLAPVRPAASEVRSAIAVLLEPHLRSRLRVLELLEPIWRPPDSG
jgi:DNA repair protein RecO (recombination protein O)